MFLRVVSVVSVVLLLSSTVFSATYYISPSGNNTNDGLTEETAFVSPQSALIAMKRNTDNENTIYFTQGTHTNISTLILNGYDRDLVITGHNASLIFNSGVAFVVTNSFSGVLTVSNVSISGSSLICAFYGANAQSQIIIDNSFITLTTLNSCLYRGFINSPLSITNSRLEVGSVLFILNNSLDVFLSNCKLIARNGNCFNLSGKVKNLVVNESSVDVPSTGYFVKVGTMTDSVEYVSVFKVFGSTGYFLTCGNKVKDVWISDCNLEITHNLLNITASNQLDRIIVKKNNITFNSTENWLLLGPGAYSVNISDNNVSIK